MLRGVTFWLAALPLRQATRARRPRRFAGPLTSLRCACHWYVLACSALLTPAAMANSSKPLPLASVSAVAFDLEGQKTLLAKHADTQLPIASVTKVMTALVVLDSEAPLDTWLRIHDWHAELDKNAYSRIRIDSQARRRDLLRIALMSSENRAAYNLGVHHPGGVDALVTAMNAKARELGMTRTLFVDPMGLSPDNRSTASDLARLAAAAYDVGAIREYSTTRQHTVNYRAPRYRLGYGNTNPLLGSSRWTVEMTKTGYLTEAGRCLLMIADVNGRATAMVLLNSFGKRSPLGDAGRIRRWLESGTVSRVATAARDYEQRTLETLGLIERASE